MPIQNQDYIEEEARQTNVEEGNMVTLENKVKGNIKYKKNRENLPEEEVFGKEDKQMMKDQK